MLPGINPGQSSTTFNATEFPKTVARTLNQGSAPTSMDFHPVQHTLLLGLLSFPLRTYLEYKMIIF